jgi:NADH:ubiquinone oxidoreductase subunit F (NADH-binding)
VRLLAADVLLPAAGQREVQHRAESLAEHFGRLGPRPVGDLHLLTVLDDAGLTGHGGGHVPVAAKWRRTLAGRGPLTVVANGAESEPWSAKDASLLRQRPHLVLDGLLLAAEALGARRAVMWLHGADGADHNATLRAVADAVRERAVGAGLAIELLVGPAHYLTGESSAVAQAVAGGPALPTARRPRGVLEPRTLVHNVETLARISLAARRFPATATVLLTVVGAAGRLVTEVARGSALLDAVRAAGWTTGSGRPQGALLGGYGGTWVSWEDLVRARVDQADPVGRLLGAGIVAPLPHGTCPVEATAEFAEYLAGMSAGQCGPCVFGLPAVAASVRRLADGRPGRAEIPRLAADLDAVAGRGACHHPDGVVGLVRSLRATFPDHVAAHERGQTCDAGGWG